MPNYEPWSAEKTAQIIAEHKGLEGPLLPILHALQEAFGYIDRAAEPIIAEALNVSRAEVHGVVTFYHDFREQPAGRHVLKLCRAEACQAAGGEALAAQAEASLGVAFGQTRPTAASLSNRSTASGSARCRRRRCSTAASSPGSTGRSSMCWWRRPTDERASHLRSRRCGGRCLRR